MTPAAAPLRNLLAAGLVLAALLPAACNRTTPTLRVYSPSDYVKPAVVARFQKEQGCRVVIDAFDTTESMYATLKAGASGYDLVISASAVAWQMHEQGLLQELRREQLPNLKNVDPAYLRIAVDSTMLYSVPYVLNATGIGYLASSAGDLEPTWAVFDRAEFKGRMALLDDSRETIGAALKLLGYSLNSRDDNELAAARDVVSRWRRNLVRFERGKEGGGLLSGKISVSHGHSAAVFPVQEENDDVGFLIPREGAAMASDDLVIPGDARQVQLAHAFINFLHKPEVAAENSDFLAYLCPNAPSYDLLDVDLKNDPTVFIPPEVMARCEAIADLGADNSKYARVWDQIRAAR